MRLKDLPAGERPRERLRARGARACSTVEILALLVDRGVPGRSAKEAAEALLARFGSLGGLSAASVDAVREASGIGEAAAVRVVAGLEIARRLAEEKPRGRPDLDLAAEIEALRGRIGGASREVCVAVLFDARRRRIGDVDVTAGTLSANLLPPREVLKHALGRGAAAVLVAHNHPSGDPTPSREDLEATDRLVLAARAVGVEVIDHVVVAAEGAVRIIGARDGRPRRGGRR